ncbi:hypothetical protein MFIFM68171_05847 [Madurella fahalii]|uniref:Uncharacterized protein n=1 Tax=Madurella fahalii TaxID=1157608 RepID=A0ABQ0GCZ3_9PEZI
MSTPWFQCWDPLPAALPAVEAPEEVKEAARDRCGACWAAKEEAEARRRREGEGVYSEVVEREGKEMMGEEEAEGEGEECGGVPDRKGFKGRVKEVLGGLKRRLSLSPSPTRTRKGQGMGDWRGDGGRDSEEFVRQNAGRW